MTKVRIKNVKSVKVKIEPEKKVYTKVPLYLRPHKLHEHEDASDLAVSTEGQLIRKSGNNWVAFTPEYYEDKNRTPGAVLFAGADGKISEDGNLTWDNSNYKSFYGGQQLRAGNVLYANSPSYSFANNPFTGSLIIGGGGTAVSEQFIFNHIGLNQRPIYRNTRINGTYGSPTSVLAGQSLWEMQLYAYSSSTNSFISNSNSPINILINSDAAPSFNTTIILTGGTGNAPSIHVKNNGVVIGNRGIPYTQLANARLEVFGANSNSLSWTAQFHNSSGVSNSLMIRDDSTILSGVNTIYINAEEFNYTRTGVANHIIRSTSGIANSYIVGSTQSILRLNTQTGNQWLLRTSGTNLDVVDNTLGSNIISITPRGRQTHFLNYIATANNDFGWNFTGTLTARNTASDTLNGVLINPTLVAAANSQSLIGVQINLGTNLGAFTGSTIFPLFVASNTSNAVLHEFQNNGGGSSSLRLSSSGSFTIGRNNGAAGSASLVNSGTGSIVLLAGATARSEFNSNGDLSVGLGFSGAIINARTHIRGSSALTGNALLVENSSPNPILIAYNTRITGFYSNGFGSGVGVRINNNVGSDLAGLSLYSDAIFFNQFGQIIYSQSTSVSPNGAIRLTNISTFAPINGSRATEFGIGSIFAPASGSSDYVALLINTTVNQTGFANGITRGILISPTLTSAFDYRAIEVTIGRSMFRNIEVQNGDTISFGSPNTDGTWRFIRNGNDLIIQRRESGVYNTKQTIAA